MNTLSKEKELIELMVRKIDEATDQNVKVICTDDYTEERSDYMVAIGITNTVQCHADNPFLPDYEYTLNILIDCFIAEDKEGFFFEKTKSEVLDFLEPYIMDRTKLEELFEEIPVVGFILNGITNTTSEQSNKCIISFRVIASY